MLADALLHPGTRHGIVSITLDQARLSWDLAAAIAQENQIIRHLVAKKGIKETPFPTIRFKNGSTITARSTARGGIYIRGHKFHTLRVDEADYIPEKTIDEAIRMTLADIGGELILLTTPKPKRGLVYRELQRGLAGHPTVYAQQGPTFENPNVDHDYIRSLRDRMTASAWAREILGLYSDDDTVAFRWDDIVASYQDADWELNRGPHRDSDGIVDRSYVAGWDLAKTTDWTVGTVLDITTVPHKLVHWERFNRRPWPEVAERIRHVHKDYRCYKTLIDATGLGGVVLDLLTDIGAEGFIFNKNSKIELIGNLQLAFEKRTIQAPFIQQLVDELQAYVLDDDEELVTDSVMSLALAEWAAGPRYKVEYAPGLYS